MRSALFRQLLETLIDLALAGGKEQALLESLNHHLGEESTTATPIQQRF